MVQISKYSDMISGPEQVIKEVEVQSIINHLEDDQCKYGSIDPRSDKAVDHKYWIDLLWNAWHWDIPKNPLYYLLHGIRCGGGELTLTKESFRLLQGEWSDMEWEEIKRKDLSPVKDKLVKLLGLSRFGKVSDVFDQVEKVPTAEVVGTEQGRMFG